MHVSIDLFLSHSDKLIAAHIPIARRTAGVKPDANTRLLPVRRILYAVLFLSGRAAA